MTLKIPYSECWQQSRWGDNILLHRMKWPGRPTLHSPPPPHLPLSSPAVTVHSFRHPDPAPDHNITIMCDLNSYTHPRTYTMGQLVSQVLRMMITTDRDDAGWPHISSVRVFSWSKRGERKGSQWANERTVTHPHKWILDGQRNFHSLSSVIC